MWRLPRQHRTPRTVRPVLLLRIDRAHRPAINHDPLHRRTANMMRSRPPAIHLLGKDAEGPRRIGSHANALTYGLNHLGLHIHRHRVLRVQLSLRHVTSPLPSLEMLPGPHPRSCPDTFATSQSHSDPNCSTAAFLM